MATTPDRIAALREELRLMGRETSDISDRQMAWLATLEDPAPCAECGGKRNLPGEWCSACLMVAHDYARERET